MSIPVILDTASAFGLPNTSIDSGLALIYLLGRKDIDIKGITVTAGQYPLDAVFDSVSWLLRLCRRMDIPLISGAGKAGEYDTEASAFIADSVSGFPGELTLISNAPLGNIHGASLINREFYSEAGQLICTGGRIYPMQVAGLKMGDLNFCSDSLAAESVLTRSMKPVIINMHIGCQLLFSMDDLLTIQKYNIQLYYLVKETLLSSSPVHSGKKFSFLPSILSAIYPGNDNLFNNVECDIKTRKKGLQKGLIDVSENGNRVIMPDYIRDIDEVYGKMHQGLNDIAFGVESGQVKIDREDSI